MDNENIKEILDKLLKYFKESNVNDFGYEQDKLISYEEAQVLLDCITNLQESEAYYYGQYKDYKSRCEKLREYINTHQLFKYIHDDEELFEIITDKEEKKDLLNILNGGDDND